MAANLAVNKTDFEKEVINSEVPVLVDFWATWCRPCVAIAPFVAEIAEEVAERGKVFKVDVDEERDLGEKYAIMSIPALLVFKGGREVDRMVGAGSKADIKAFFEKHL